MRKDIIPYYKALGLAPGAEPLEIRRAYRQMIQQWHPDLYKPGSPMQTTAEDITKEINEAYDQLYRKKLYRNFPRKKEPQAERKPAEKTEEPDENEESPKSAQPGMRRRPRAKAEKKEPSWWVRVRRARFWRHSWVVAVACLFVGGCVLGWRFLDSLSWPSPPPQAAMGGRAKSASALTPSPAGMEGAEMPRVSAAVLNKDDGRTSASIGLREPHAAAPALIDRASALLDVFEAGDSKAKVREIQGPPDESGETIFRYGSSVVYFRNGLVSSWIDRQPRLRVRDWEVSVLPSLDPFSKGSTRSDVVRAQGLPEAFTPSTYTYGSSVVYFGSGRVTGWSEGDVPLQNLALPRLSFIDLDLLVDEQLRFLDNMPR